MDRTINKVERQAARSELLGASSERRRLDRSFLILSRRIGYWQVSINVGAFFGLLWCASIANNAWEYGALLIALGFAERRLFFPLHDCIHYSLFPKAAENRFFGGAISAMLLTSFESIRAQHMEHHRLVGLADDPGATDYFVRFRSKQQLLGFIIGPAFGSIIFKKFGDYFTRPIRAVPTDKSSKTQSRLSKIVRSYGVIICIQFAIFALVTRGFAPSKLWRYPAFVVLPLITIFLFLVRLRLFLEHGSLNYEICDYFEGKHPTARTIYGNALEMSIFCGSNFNYHHEHHLHPVVPGCQLPRLHRELDTW